MYRITIEISGDDDYAVTNACDEIEEALAKSLDEASQGATEAGGEGSISVGESQVASVRWTTVEKR